APGYDVCVAALLRDRASVAADVARANLTAGGKARKIGRVVAYGIADTLSEGSRFGYGTGVAVVGPEALGGEETGSKRWSVAPDRAEIVIGREEVPDLDRTPGALQTHEGIAAGDGATAVIGRHRRLDLEDCVQTAAERLRAAHTE